MDKQAAFEIVSGYLQEQFDVPAEKIQLQSHLFSDLELDSIDALDMIGLLEARLQVQVDEEELKKIRTVEDVVAYVVAHAPAQEAAGK